MARTGWVVWSAVGWADTALSMAATDSERHLQMDTVGTALGLESGIEQVVVCRLAVSQVHMFIFRTSTLTYNRLTFNCLFHPLINVPERLRQLSRVLRLALKPRGLSNIDLTSLTLTWITSTITCPRESLASPPDHTRGAIFQVPLWCWTRCTLPVRSRPGVLKARECLLDHHSSSDDTRRDNGAVTSY